MSQSRNTGRKAATREYAAEHQLSYQQAQRKLGYHGRSRSADDGYALTIGTSVNITPDPAYQDYADYSLCRQETIWRPFSTRTGSCVLIDHAAPSVLGALVHQAAAHPTHPVTDVLMIGPIEDPENYPEFNSFTNAPAISFQNLVLANEHTGYGAAGAAAAALSAFRPRDTGVVLVDIEDPFDQVTPETNETDFEANYRGTQWESHFRPMEVTDGPYWSESTGPQQEVLHVLSDAEQQAYARYLSEVSNLLDRAGLDRIIVLMSGADLRRTIDRFPVQHFGTRLSGAVRLEYQYRPELHTGRYDLPALAEMFPGYESLLSASPGEAFWPGVEPKENRVALARLNGRQDPELLLLKDPPEVPYYWAPSYAALRSHWVKQRS